MPGVPDLPQAWLVRLARALEHDDPETALVRALEALAEVGVAPRADDGASASLVVEHGRRRLALDGADALDDGGRALVHAVLHLALRRAAEHDERRRLQARLDMLSAASFEGLIFHSEGVAVDANQRFGELLGYAPEEIPGLDTFVCVAPEDRPEARRRVANRIEGEYVITGLRKDGSRFRAELLSKEGHLGDQALRVVAVRDVTERERTNALLRESEARLRDLATVAFDFIIYSRDGIVVEAHGDVERMMGWKPSEILGRPILDFIASSGQPIVREKLGENALGSYETALVRPDGEAVPTLVVATTSTLAGQPVRVAGIRDLRPERRLDAERRALEQRVERAQRLDSLGVLAGGIAHDFNNLLAGVLGNAELLLETVTGAERESAQAIVTAAQRAATLTRQMLVYARQRDLGRREPVDLDGVLRELRELLGAILSKKARFEIAIEPDSVVLGDRATLGQVLMNLLANASDALGDAPGDIRVRTRRVREVDARWDAAQGATVRPGDWVLVEIEDTGAGMDETTRGRVFEPFFSTKEAGHGLGLAACLGIVTAHGGAILVESEPGRGSRFSILLPATQAAAGAAAAPAARAPVTPCTVLVVDDEALVRTQLRRTLELRGYVVVEAPDGRSALDHLASGAPRPDVVILDMTMPDLDGAEVLRRLRAAGDRVPVVISSGYLDVSLERRLPRGEFQGFLPKPYGATDLVNAIEAARRAR
jgi:PAS domain S-box-containing protein